MVLFLDEPEQIMKFSNLHQCTFNYVSVFVFSYLFVCLFHCILLSVLQKIPWRVQGPVETFSQKYVIAFFFIWIFFLERFTGQQRKGGAIYSTPLHYFHPLHRNLDNSRKITAESSPLHLASSRTRTRNLWLLSVSRQPLSYAP